MSRASILALTLSTLLVGACKEKPSGANDALKALDELAREQPGMAFNSMLADISKDPRIRNDEKMRPDSLSFFSMLQEESAEITYHIFMVGNDVPGMESWELTFGGRSLSPKRISPGSWGADIDKTTDGRFSYFALVFDGPRDELINALQDQAQVSLSCRALTTEPWTFYSSEFATKLQQVRDAMREAEEPVMEVHLLSRQIDFYSAVKIKPAQSGRDRD